MADYASYLYLRKPLIEGRRYKAGGLNETLRQLAQLREEVTAVETALGTNPQGSAASVAARLDVRHAKCGLRRGQVFQARSANRVTNSGYDVMLWFDGGDRYVQWGLAGPYTTTGVKTITYPKAYFSTLRPDLILAAFVSSSSDANKEKCGDVQVIYDQITDTTFKVQGRGYTGAAGAATWGDATNGWYALWVAYGGFPSS